MFDLCKQPFGPLIHDTKLERKITGQRLLTKSDLKKKKKTVSPCSVCFNDCSNELGGCGYWWRTVNHKHVLTLCTACDQVWAVELVCEDSRLCSSAITSAAMALATWPLMKARTGSVLEKEPEIWIYPSFNTSNNNIYQWLSICCLHPTVLPVGHQGSFHSGHVRPYDQH